MPPVDQGLFKGVAIIFDDQVDKPEKGDKIHIIMRAIREAGGHTVNLASLPEEGVDLDNFSNAAFFIMDWDFQGVEDAAVPEALKQEQVRNNIAFLKRLSDHRHAPVFIFTNESPAMIDELLRGESGLYHDAEASHIMVRQKGDVESQVYEVLNTWAQKAPSVITLKTWERELIKATNALFKDFHNKVNYWPVLLWQTFDDDDIPAADELGRLISRLVMSRMKPLDINLEAFVKGVEEIHRADPVGYRQALMKVLEGERFLDSSRLDPQSVSTGDVFSCEEGGEKVYYLNVRAECDCVLRGGKSVDLYMLRGTVVEDAHSRIDPSFGKIMEKDNEAIIFAMTDGRTIRFGFRKIYICKWRDSKDKRIGRLLPPFLTNLLQRFAAYSHRPGLPRIPRVLGEAPAVPTPPPVHPG